MFRTHLADTRTLKLNMDNHPPVVVFFIKLKENFSFNLTFFSNVSEDFVPFVRILWQDMQIIVLVQMV